MGRASKISDFQVVHEQNQNEFYIGLDGGQKAYIKYRISENNSESQLAKREVDFYTTYVPDDHRGKGLAAILVESAFNWAEENSLQVAASCSYVAIKLNRKPKDII